jgi:hypothetical protein
MGRDQGCQVVYFQTKIKNEYIFGGSCNGRCWLFYGHMAYIHTLQTFGILYGHFVYFVVIWYIFPHFDMTYQEKSGDTGFSSTIYFWPFQAN